MSAAGKAEAGFTLIEMLVVLAAIGLIGGLVYPAMRNLAAIGQLHDTAGRIAVVLETARARAIRTAGPIRIDISSLPPASALYVAISPVAGIVFYPDGSATGGGIEIAAAGQRIHYAVTPATGAIVRAAP